MKRIYAYLFFALICLFIVSACSDKDSDDVIQKKYVNNWILSNMRQYYLWNDKVPTNIDKSMAPDKYFYSLLYKYPEIDGDRFSWIQENFLDLINSLSGIEKEAGYSFNLIRISNSEDLLGFISYIKPNSPAATAGLKRGDLFIKINNKTITLKNYNTLWSETAEAHTLGLAVIKDRVITPADNVTLSTVEYHENPIFLSNIYEVDNKKIGYLVYNFFAADDGDNTIKYNKQLNAVFGDFKTNGVNELILDLRYNSGGAVSSAVYLASMIVKNLNTNNVVIKRQYNTQLNAYLVANYGEGFLVDKFQNTIKRTDNEGKVLETVPLNNLNLPRVYIITSYKTASASELIINALKPYMDVYLVGDVTAGKNVASISIYEENDPKNKWGMQPIVLKTSNSVGFSGFEAGFTPDITLEEYGDFTNIKPLGDPNEILLAATLQYLSTGRTNAVAKAKSGFDIQNVAIKQQQRGMYVGKPLLLQQVKK